MTNLKKQHPILFSTPMVKALLNGSKTQTRRIVKKQPHGAGEWIMLGISWFFPNVNPYVKIKCPYGKIGDILWVKETYAPFHDGFAYKADFENWKQYVWKPSIFMPKEACRIRLEITDIRVERVQSISEADAIKEGAPDSMLIDELSVLKDMDWIIPSPFLMHQFSFLALWCKINGQSSWLSNPWVWVISFKKL